MRLFRIFSKDAANSAAGKLGFTVKKTVLALIITALLAGCGGCSQCRSCRAEEDIRVVRTPSDVKDLTVIFINGEATLFWTDSDDPFLDFIEIT